MRGNSRGEIDLQMVSADAARTCSFLFCIVKKAMTVAAKSGQLTAGESGRVSSEEIITSSCRMLLPVFLTTQKVEAIPLSAFLAQGHNKRTCRPIFTLTLFNDDCQVGKV